MEYEVEFEYSALIDLKESVLYEVQFLFSVDKAKERMWSVMDQAVNGLSSFPARFPERPYGFTKDLRRAYPIGKYTAFYWIDEPSTTVHIEHVLPSKADFGRIHFGN